MSALQQEPEKDTPRSVTLSPEKLPSHLRAEYDQVKEIVKKYGTTEQYSKYNWEQIQASQEDHLYRLTIPAKDGKVITITASEKEFVSNCGETFSCRAKDGKLIFPSSPLMNETLDKYSESHLPYGPDGLPRYFVPKGKWDESSRAEYRNSEIAAQLIKEQSPHSVLKPIQAQVDYLATKGVTEPLKIENVLEHFFVYSARSYGVVLAEMSTDMNGKVLSPWMTSGEKYERMFQEQVNMYRSAARSTEGERQRSLQSWVINNADDISSWQSVKIQGIMRVMISHRVQEFHKDYFKNAAPGEIAKTTEEWTRAEQAGKETPRTGIFQKLNAQFTQAGVPATRQQASLVDWQDRTLKEFEAARAPKKK